MTDSILFWNAVALEANRVSHSDPAKREQPGPTLSSRALAIVHIAMYDAYAGIVNDAAHYPRYFASGAPIPVAAATVPRDAVAGAAHTTLSALYRAQREYFDAQLSCFDAFMAGTTTPTPSFEFGMQVGQKLLDLRVNDMDARDCGYIPSQDRSRHRVDPDNPGQGYYSPYYGAQNDVFAAAKRHDLDHPPFDGGTDKKYLQALRDVRARGIRPDLTGTLPDPLFARRRTAEETLIGIFWGYDGSNRLGTPPRFYNHIVRQVASNQKNSEGQNARLFALVNAAMGDAGILAWEQKYCHDFWRPVLGIREHDETLGPAAPYKVAGDVKFNDGDPGWLPLGAPSTNSPTLKNATPNFPAYPSGHATFGAAALHMTRMFYKVDPNDKKPDKLFPGFLVSDEFNGGNQDNTGTVRPRHTRFFPGGLWSMIIENAASRVLLGVHWTFDAFDFTAKGDELAPDLTNERIGGVGLGLRIARDIFAAGGGLAPRMPATPPAPPITTPAKSSPMPTAPQQPGSVKGCANTPKAAGKKGAAEAADHVQPGSQSQVQTPFPSGRSPR